jgi:hypothetical protein
MIFTHANQASAWDIIDRICVAEGAYGREWTGRLTKLACIDALIGEIGEVYDALSHTESTPTILMHHGAGAVWLFYGVSQ